MAATYLSHRNTQEGPCLLGVSAGCHHRRGPRMGPALSPPSPCCMCLHDSGPRGSRRANPCEGLMPSLYGRSPRRFTTGCRPTVPRGRHARRGSDPSPVHGTCFGVVAWPIRWPERLRGQPVGVTGCSGLFFDRRRRSVECGSGIKYTAQHRMMEQWLLFHCFDKTLTTAAGVP